MQTAISIILQAAQYSLLEKYTEEPEKKAACYIGDFVKMSVKLLDNKKDSYCQ